MDTWEVLGKHVIKLYSKGISRFVKIGDAKKDIENDPIIKDQMAGLGCLFVCTSGDYVISILTAAHTANNVVSGDEQDHENEDYESDKKNHILTLT